MRFKKSKIAIDMSTWLIIGLILLALLLVLLFPKVAEGFDNFKKWLSNLI